MNALTARSKSRAVPTLWSRLHNWRSGEGRKIRALSNLSGGEFDKLVTSNSDSASIRIAGPVLSADEASPPQVAG